MSLRYQELTRHSPKSNSLKSEAMLIMTSIIRAGKSDMFSSKLDEDSENRILTCLRVLALPENSVIKSVFLQKGKNAFSVLISDQEVL
jgi:coatomer subunit beta